MLNDNQLNSANNQQIDVLLVEDNPEHAKLISMYLEISKWQSFDLVKAISLDQALNILQTQDFDIILLDLSLPESSGLSTFYSLHARGRGIPIVVLSGTNDEILALEAVRGGAQDYLVKGQADQQHIIRSIRYALERKRSEVALRRSEERFRSLIENASDLIALIDSNNRFIYASPSHNKILGHQAENLLGRNIIDFLHPDEMDRVLKTLIKCQDNPHRTFTQEFRLRHQDTGWRIMEGFFRDMSEDSDKIQIAVNSHDITDRAQKERELQIAYDATLEGWAFALELRDKEVIGHSRRVTDSAVKLAKAVGLKGEDLIHFRRGCLLHDIGKMGIPDSILQKEGPLTDEEWEIMRKHPEYAYDMLFPISYLRPALEIPYCHHERWDGKGYPRGLNKNAIPLAARIFSVIDVWDALITSRPYSTAWDINDALDYINQHANSHFDPEIVEIFLQVFTPKTT